MASAVSAHFERERRGLPGWGSLAPLYFICTRLYIQKTHTYNHTKGTYLHNLTQEKRVPSPRPLGPYIFFLTLLMMKGLLLLNVHITVW